MRDQVLDDLQLMELSRADRLDIAGQLESVQEACGFDSSPTSFVADYNLSRTVYLTLTSDDIACVSTVASLSNAKGEWTSLAMVLLTSVLPQ